MVLSAQFNSDQIDSLGRALYDEWRTADSEARARGRFIVFDVRSKDYEIADSDIEATDRLLQRRPDGVLWGTRVGHPAAYRLGIRTLSPG